MRTITEIKQQKNLLTKPEKVRACAYIRVSTDNIGQLNSLQNQKEYYERKLGSSSLYEFCGIYSDCGISGAKEERPGFKAMMEKARAGEVDIIYTKSISRFARNTITLLETVRELKNLGVDVFFEEQNIHTMSGDGELMLTILASYAQEESRSVSENCKWRIRKRFENGELANLRFMFGYQINKSKVEIDLEQAAVVRMIFEDYINGMGGGQIAKKLKGMNIAKVFNGKWCGERVIEILKNEKYTGNSLLQKKYVVDHLSKKLVWNKGDLPMYFAEDTHPAIIDQETFDKAQAILEKRRILCSTKCGSRNRYPFSVVIQCGICGKKYKRKDRKGKVAWYCSTFLQEGKSACPSKQIPEPVLYSLCNEVLEMDEFDADSFVKVVAEILVPEPNKVIFVLRDGSQVEKTWQHISRRESWTKEMREAARNHVKRRC